MASSDEIQTQSWSLGFQILPCLDSNDTDDDSVHFQLTPTLTPPWKVINGLCSFEIINLTLSKISGDSTKACLL